MSNSKLRTLRIDETQFSFAFERDVDFHDTCPVTTYLDLETGETVWIYEEDHDAEMEVGIAPEENQTMRERAEAMPERYLEIPGLDHGDHHDILRDFLDSEWSEVAEQRVQARNAYAGSIGRWKQSVDRSTVHAFESYRERKTRQMAKEFLRQHGVEPEWH